MPILRQNFSDSHQSVPNVMVSFIRYAVPDTFHSNSNQENQINIQRALATKKDLVVVSDVLSATITSSKSSYQGQAEIALASGDINYLAAVKPGDHAFVWLFNNYEDFDRISKKATGQQQMNDYNSGLKFYGKVNSVREDLSTDSKGIKSLRYVVTLKSFSEFNTQLYYNPLLANSNRVTDLYGSLTTAFNALFVNGVIPISNAIDFFIDIFFGSGPDTSFNKPDGNKTASPNYSFNIPAKIKTILTGQNTGIGRFMDVLTTIYGIQQYESGSYFPNASNSSYKGDKVQARNQYYCTSNLVGGILAFPDAFNNTTMWSLFQSISNPAVNEMYCTLRADKFNNIVPTFTVRQIPFTSKFFKAQSINHTNFLELPRWVIDSSYPLISKNIGNSDAARFNFVQAYTKIYELENNPSRSLQIQVSEGNYAIDTMDVLRNGTRIYTSVSDSGITSDKLQENLVTLTNVNAWKDLIADWYINGHLKMNGTIMLAGVQEPIAIGDNVQVEDKLFHIEGVTHMYSVAPNGLKSFITQLAVSNGVLTNGHYVSDLAELRSAVDDIDFPGFSDAEKYIAETNINSTTADTTTNSIVQQAQADINGVQTQATAALSSLKSKIGIK